jgi:hypothetical protein
MLIYLFIVLNDLLFVVLKSIERVEKGEHGLGKVLGLRYVYLNIECERDIVEDIFS